MHPLARSLAAFDYAPPRQFANLVMIPLLLRKLTERIYLTLDEALPTGRFRVTEVSAGGHVPELRVQNDLDTPVLLLDGEELVGAKQNRVVNLTILVPAHITLTIPVSCVESGRWQHVAPEFATSGRAHFREGRVHKLAQVTRSLEMCASAVADQSDVWARISERAASLGTHSPTSAMNDIYESYRHSVDEFVSSLAMTDGQAGAAFAIDGRLAGVEFFDSPHTMARLLPKIVSSYALDAVATSASDQAPRFERTTVEAWLGHLSQLQPTTWL